MRYLLILGSNFRRAQALRLAARRLGENVTIVAAAGPSRTRDAKAGSRYLNAAVVIESTLAFDQLRAAMKAIEREAGRESAASVCALDIDVVARLAGGQVAEVYKPADLQAGYAAPLLRALGIGVMAEAPLK